jgi:hypothetical protein
MMKIKTRTTTTVRNLPERRQRQATINIPNKRARTRPRSVISVVDVDHKQITSGKCLWKGLSAKEVILNYAQRVRETKMRIQIFPSVWQGPVQVVLGSMYSRLASIWRQCKLYLCNIRTHETHQVHSCHEGLMPGNPITIDPLPSLEDIFKIFQVLSLEDAILIARTEIVCLDDLSLDGDIANNISV